MTESNHRVSLVTDLDEIMEEMVPQQILMVSPRYNRKYTGQQVKMKAELVSLSSLNLARVKTFEIL